jgi:hypothetical protein
LRRYTEDGSITMTVRGQYRPEKNVLGRAVQVASIKTRVVESAYGFSA